VVVLVELLSVVVWYVVVLLVVLVAGVDFSSSASTKSFLTITIGGSVDGGAVDEVVLPGVVKSTTTGTGILLVSVVVSKVPIGCKNIY